MDAFVFKLDSLGNSLNAFSFGGKLDEFVSDMAIDYSGNIGVTGVLEVIRLFLDLENSPVMGQETRIFCNLTQQEIKHGLRL